MIYSYIIFFSIAATFLTFGVAIYKSKTLINEMRVLLLYTFIAAIVEIMVYVFAELKIHNLFLLNGYTLFEFSLFSLFYRQVFANRKYSIAIIIIVLCFYGVSIYEYMFFDRSGGVNISTIAIESIILMCFSLISFYGLMKKLEYTNVFQNPLFWVNSSVLIYFSGSLFLFLFSNIILTQAGSKIWILHNVLNLIYNTFLITAFWKTSKR